MYKLGNSVPNIVILLQIFLTIVFSVATCEQGCGAGVGIVKSRRLLGGVGFLTTLQVGVGFLTTLGVGVGFFCPTPTPDVQWDHFLHHTPKLGIPVEMVQFL